MARAGACSGLELADHQSKAAVVCLELPKPTVALVSGSSSEITSERIDDAVLRSLVHERETARPRSRLAIE
jgi:hypothetical protein